MWGMFQIRPFRYKLHVVSSGDQHGPAGVESWEHVSVSVIGKNFCPSWEEMCFVKNLFWMPTECVVQFHPPEAEYVNNHPYCLHLWKPPYDVPTPPSITIGLKSPQTL